MRSYVLSIVTLFASLAPIQALAFSMQRWIRNQEWQWALQLQLTGDGSSQQGTPPNWRIWTGNQKNPWQSTPFQAYPEDLTSGQWHTLDLQGDIDDIHQVHYINFSYDGTLYQLNQSFAATPSSGDQLVTAIELNGDSQEDPYDVYVDGIHFTYT